MSNRWKVLYQGHSRFLKIPVANVFEMTLKTEFPPLKKIVGRFIFICRTFCSCVFVFFNTSHCCLALIASLKRSLSVHYNLLSKICLNVAHHRQKGFVREGWCETSPPRTLQFLNRRPERGKMYIYFRKQITLDGLFTSGTLEVLDRILSNSCSRAASLSSSSSTLCSDKVSIERHAQVASSAAETCHQCYSGRHVSQNQLHHLNNNSCLLM